MQTLSDWAVLVPHYDGLVVDVWGVVHDGTKRYPGVVRRLEQLREHGKPLVFLSNAPRPAAQAGAGLAAFGVEACLYRAVVTSGQASIAYICQHYDGAVCYYLGPPHERTILGGLPVRVTERPGAADFILNVGHRRALQPLAALAPELDALAALGIPMLCANPDTEVIKQDGTRYPCAGELAAYYERCGAPVHYIGKPYAPIYQEARRALRLPASARLLAIGDNPHTDIRGGRREGMDTLLILSGGLAPPVETGAAAWNGPPDAVPDYVAERFGVPA